MHTIDFITMIVTMVVDYAHNILNDCGEEDIKHQFDIEIVLKKRRQFVFYAYSSDTVTKTNFCKSEM